MVLRTPLAGQVELLVVQVGTEWYLVVPVGRLVVPPGLVGAKE